MAFRCHPARLIAPLELEVQALMQRAEQADAQEAKDGLDIPAEQARRDAGQKPCGPEPKPPSATPEPKAQYNFTDPPSSIMKAGSAQGRPVRHLGQWTPPPPPPGE